ncbi:co-chaperone YbbN [Dysgonomonas sp. BGC7]|uniref:thioredoxin family protein n=1 Tax=Dysgonomonas sp. BGC7 TaxID=1658008 RepID=UPI000682695E|nr:thioredoxin family protein [Dysgonomonas sp. BGC7]MBD8387402.1 thioredoxin family protein [Dysgonomonas sp. BGC7]
MKTFQLREIHFIFLIIALTGGLYLIGDFKRKEYRLIEDNIPEVKSTFFADSLKKEPLCFLLFYINDSDICNEMKNNLENLRLNTGNIKIYKVNVDRYPELIDKYNVSGVPSVLIFREGVENKRIMGIVPYSNLEMIYKRQIK